MQRAWIVLAALLATATAAAAEIETLKVRRVDGQIQVRSRIVLEADQQKVFKALADYDRFSLLSARYKASRFLEPAEDGTPRIYTRIEGCVMFFCRAVDRYAQLELVPDTDIYARVESENSDVKYGYERWHLEPTPAGTRVIYAHDMNPDFWIPPLLGIWAIRKVLEADAMAAAEKLEELALGKLQKKRRGWAKPKQ